MTKNLQEKSENSQGDEKKGSRSRRKDEDQTFQVFQKDKNEIGGLSFSSFPCCGDKFWNKEPPYTKLSEHTMPWGASANLPLTLSLFSFIIPRKHNKMPQMFKKKSELKSSFSRTKSVTFFCLFVEWPCQLDRYKFHCCLSRQTTELFLLYSVLFISYSVQQKQQKKRRKKKKELGVGGGALIYTVAMNRLDWVLTQQAGDGLDCLFQD